MNESPILPLLSSTPPEHHAKIDHTTQVQLALERQYAQKRVLR
jgi:4-hydroxy-tetrahydrodipicolinate synthase